MKMVLDLQFEKKIIEQKYVYVFHLSKYELHRKNESILARKVKGIHKYPRIC